MGGAAGRIRSDRRTQRSTRRARAVPAAAVPGAELIHLGGGETIPCPDAPTLPVVDRAHRLGLGSAALALPPARLHLFRDVVVDPGSGVVLDTQGRPVAESLPEEPVALPRASTTVPGGVLAVYRSPARSRYHTLIDHLPRAALLAHPAMRRFGAVTLLHDGPLDPLEAWLLRRLVGRSVHLRQVEPGVAVRAERVLLPHPATRTGAAAIPSWYRRWADRATDAPPGRGSRRLFVEPPPGRVPIANRSELDAVFHRHGIEGVDVDALAPAESVAAFRDAEWVLGVHGAGLSMAVFARQARVVELLAGSVLDPAIYYLAVSKGLPYDYVAGVGPPGVLAGPDVALTVDVDALDRLLTPPVL